MRMRTQKRKTLLLHSARLHTVAIVVLTNVTPPPPLTFVYFCKGAVAGDAIAAALPLGRILAAHRTDSNRSTVRRFLSQRRHVRLSPWKRKSPYVDRFYSLTSHINLSAVKNRFSLFACKSFLVEKFVFPAYNFAAVRREFLLRYAASMQATYAGSIMSRTVCNYNRKL